MEHQIDSGDEDPIIELQKSKDNFIIRKVSKNSDSEVWKHFGEIFHNSGSVIADRRYTDKIFCIHCFSNAERKNPKFKSYSKFTSSSVLYSHLEHEHNVKRESFSFQRKQRKLEDSFFGPSVSKKIKKEEQESFLINRKICVWLCKDLLPFSLVENIGFRDFWPNFHKSMLPPSRSTVSREALDDVYWCIKRKLIQTLENSPKHGVITFDAWTDRFRKHSYCTYTYHFIEDWTMKSVILKTARFDQPHNAKTLKENFLSTTKEYKIDDKSFLAVTDGGANMIKCLELLNIRRIGCFAHRCNRLIVHDLMKSSSMKPFEKILDKIKKSQRKLCFKYSVLKEKAETDRQNKLLLMLDDLCYAYESLVAESQHVDNEDIEELEQEFSAELNKSESDFHGLYSSNPIRWSCLNNTIECHLKHQSIIRSTLEDMGCYELILSKQEIKLLDGLVSALKPFADFTKLIQGVNYPTINLIPLLVTEIEDGLENLKLFANDELILGAVDILLSNIRKRIELSEVVVAAGCLDPAVQRLSIIDSWLLEKEMSRAQLIRNVAQDLNIELPPSGEVIMDNAAATERQNPVDRDNKVSVIISQLISKHTTTNMSRSGTIESELISFKDVTESDSLTFWKNNHEKYPNLSSVAKVILQIPISNSKSEGAFSIAGCLLRDKRASIDPLRAERVLFVHDNYNLIQF